MNIIQKLKITNIVFGQLINSGALVHVDCLEVGDFSATPYIGLISASLKDKTWL